jgi:hypothetical protein
MLNSSVNSYRRLDPHFEAPNQIKASANDRGSMVRIPLGNERSARRGPLVAPDANPYMAIYAMLRAGLEGPVAAEDDDRKERTRFLPDNIYDAIRLFKSSDFDQEAAGRGGRGQVRGTQDGLGRALPQVPRYSLIKTAARSSSTTRSRTSTSGVSSSQWTSTLESSSVPTLGQRRFAVHSTFDLSCLTPRSAPGRPTAPGALLGARLWQAVPA